MLYYECFDDHVVVFPLYPGYWCITVASKGESIGTLLVRIKERLSGWILGVRFDRPSRKYSLMVYILIW